MLLSLLLLTILLLHHALLPTLSYVLTDDGQVLVPLNFKLSDGSSRQLHFAFSLIEEHLEQRITDYCELQNIRYHFCYKLLSFVQGIQLTLQREQAEKRFVHSMYSYEDNEEMTRLSTRRNPKLAQHQLALQALLQGRIRYSETLEEMVMIENKTIEILTSLLHTIHSMEDIVRICVIHYEAYSKTDTREVEDILNKLQEHSLMADLQMILVVQYGEVTFDGLPNKYPDVTFLHLTGDLSFRELPTLRILHALSKVCVQLYPSDPVHILYMRTIGTAYQVVHPQIEDWRNMMSYFMIEQHLTCYHLIESREIDVVSINYVNNPRALNGNYFWSSSVFISQLPLLPLNAKRFYTVSSEWLFSSPLMKLHVLHSSHINHEFHRYPKYCYRNVSSDEVPDYDDFKKHCSKTTLEDYSLLHNQTALTGTDFPSYSEEFHNVNSPREVTSSCSTMELSIVYES